MPGSPQSISPSPPPWNEADSIRETTLLVVEMAASYCTSCGGELGSELDLRRATNPFAAGIFHLG